MTAADEQHELLAYWIDQVNRLKRLSKVEKDFMANVTARFKLSGRLTFGQRKQLEEIYTERTAKL